MSTTVNPTTPSTTATPVQPVNPALPVYYLGLVGNSYRLFREFHPLPPADSGSSPGAIAARVQEAVTQAMSRPPDDPDYRTLWAAGAGARTTVGPDRISIVLNEAAAGGLSVAGTGADAIAIQQLWVEYQGEAAHGDQEAFGSPATDERLD